MGLGPEEVVPEGAMVAPAAGRNREAILGVLRGRVSGLVLEVASGSGEHAVWFGAALPEVVWQPSERDGERLASIAAWREAAGLANVLAPVRLDAAEADWPVARADAVVAINMIHIAPWAATLGLMAGAARVLSPGGVLVLYGPFREGGRLVESNAAFDLDLRERDAAWGVRELEAVAGVALGHGLVLSERVEMPANNLSLVFRQVDSAIP